ncbi:hypothetical protein [Thermodesulforhabdus norvegica]|uniref:Uncharacterized protein n=1 Tax=Thermodesulforhabdus norvegica TaxID=39841 RepID=A0A1I4STJ5_9BACT|nr:hypothetical protein [Thermodesulforhabdus norvegica]SFM67858.1 hypothetical protein SAMN05660836_01160 [Thermodesulforhabdus norvegica]
MKRQWDLSWSEDGVVILLKPGQQNKVQLTSVIKTPEDFRAEIDRLTEEVRELLERGLEQFRARQASQSQRVLSPEEIWISIRTMTDEEMINYFNKLEESVRRSVADYVFSHVSTFSGKGLLFAQLYDHNSAMLLND